MSTAAWKHNEMYTFMSSGYNFSGKTGAVITLLQSQHNVECVDFAVLTVFISMVMLDREDVWLSDVEQEFTEDGSWTRPVWWKMSSGFIKRYNHLIIS